MSREERELEIVERDLPALERAIERLLGEPEDAEPRADDDTGERD